MTRKLSCKTLLSACSLMLAAASMPAQAESGWSYQQIADSLNLVLASDRAVYTRLVVNRLQNKEKVIKASEHWKDDKALPLPAQMFRHGSEMVAEKQSGFSYSLISEWPINKQNEAKTEVEKEGLKAIAKSGKPFYKDETLGGKNYFTALYPDIAVSKACTSCHNDHKDSPRTDFKRGDIMGAVIIRILKN